MRLGPTLIYYNFNAGLTWSAKLNLTNYIQIEYYPQEPKPYWKKLKLKVLYYYLLSVLLCHSGAGAAIRIVIAGQTTDCQTQNRLRKKHLQ